MKMRLTVNCWITCRGREAPFGCVGPSGQTWTRILPGERLVCKGCGKTTDMGWRRGARGKTAFCRDCVILRDTHLALREDHPEEDGAL
jgi:hypothetical protein